MTDLERLQALLTVMEKCTECRGIGMYEDTVGDGPEIGTVKCHKCLGTGQVPLLLTLGLAERCPVFAMCGEGCPCQGTGWRVVPHAEGLLVGAVVKYLQKTRGYVQLQAFFGQWAGRLSKGDASEEACLVVLEGVANASTD